MYEYPTGTAKKYKKMKTSHHNLSEIDSSMDNISLNESSSSPLISTSLASSQPMGCYILPPGHGSLAGAAHNVTATTASTFGSSALMGASGLDGQYKSSVFTFGSSLASPINGSISNSTNGNTNNLNHLFGSAAGYNNRHLNGFSPRYPSANAFSSGALNNFNPLPYNQYGNLLNNTNSSVHSNAAKYLPHSNNNLLLQYINTHPCTEAAAAPVDEEKTGKIKSEN